MIIDGDDIIFSTGKKVYANGGIIGLSPCLSVTGGYDNEFYDNDENDKDEDEDLSKSEISELADFMILKWQEFKEAVR